MSVLPRERIFLQVFGAPAGKATPWIAVCFRDAKMVWTSITMPSSVESRLCVLPGGVWCFLIHRAFEQQSVWTQRRH